MTPEQREWLQFLIQLLAIVTSVFVAYYKIDKRLTNLEFRMSLIWTALRLTPFIKTPEEEG